MKFAFRMPTTQPRSIFTGLLIGTSVLSINAASAQTITIDQSALESRTDECRALGELVMERDATLEAVETETVVDAINQDSPEQCATLRQQIADANPMEQDEDQARASGEATETVNLSEEATIEGEAVVSVPEPNVDVELDPPKVRVTEGQPNVDITQGAPEIELRQERAQIDVEIPEIIVRVQIPAPTIYMLQENPRVSISDPDPQVEVSQAEPRVTVTQGEPELKVDLGVEEGETDTNETEMASAREQDGSEDEIRTQEEVEGSGEPEVEIVRAEGDPQITYQSSEPSLSYEGSEPEIRVAMANRPTIELSQSGEPRVVVESAEERQQRRDTEAAENTQQQDENAEQPQDTADAEQGAGMMTVADLMEREVRGADGESLGYPEAVIEMNGQPNIIVADGGFLGLGETEVPVPLSRVSMQDGYLLLQQMTEEEIEDASDFEYDANLELPGDHQLNLGG